MINKQFELINAYLTQIEFGEDVTDDIAQVMPKLKKTIDELQTIFEETIKDIETLKQSLEYPCEDCGSINDVEYRPCPYNSEINDDFQKLHLCQRCYNNRAEEI